LTGRRFLGRMGVAHLRQVGLDDLIAETPDDYVRIASALALDPARRAVLRGTLRGRLLDSRLCDPVRYARSIEAAYRAMWRALCAGGRWDGKLAVQ
jgi:predicted O-linked N-acetylglucosamine transferase (SPINDLY family)